MGCACLPRGIAKDIAAPLAVHGTEPSLLNLLERTVNSRNRARALIRGFDAYARNQLALQRWALRPQEGAADGRDLHREQRTRDRYGSVRRPAPTVLEHQHLEAVARGEQNVHFEALGERGHYRRGDAGNRHRRPRRMSEDETPDVWLVFVSSCELAQEACENRYGVGAIRCSHSVRVRRTIGATFGWRGVLAAMRACGRLGSVRPSRASMLAWPRAGGPLPS